MDRKSGFGNLKIKRRNLKDDVANSSIHYNDSKVHFQVHGSCAGTWRSVVGSHYKYNLVCIIIVYSLLI